MSGPSAIYRAMVAERERNHAALVRGDDGSLHVRHFATAQAAQAAQIPQDFVVDDSPRAAGRPRGRVRLSEAAREIGVHPKTFKKYLKHIRHEHPSPYVVYIPRSELDLIRIHGLHGLARMRAAGVTQ